MLYLIHARVCIKNSTNTQIHFIRPGLEILKSSIYSGEQEKKNQLHAYFTVEFTRIVVVFSMKWHIPTSLKSHAKSICQEAGSRNVKNPYKSCLLAPFLTHHHSSSSILFLNFPPYYSCRKQFINRGHRYLPLYFICFDICAIYNVTKP